MTRFVLWLALSSVAASLGCRPSVSVEWAPAEMIVPDDDRWPEAKAVILFDDFELINIVSHDTSYAQWRFHRIIRLRSRDALKLADLRIGVDKAEEILDFKARSTAKDGTVRAIDMSALQKTSIKEANEKKAHIYVAAIPGAEIGGTIEYSYAIQDDYPVWSWSHDLNRLTSIRGLPIVEARFHIAVNKFVKYAARVYNTRDKIDVTRDGSISHLRWRSTDLAPGAKERWSPPDDVFPRLQFKVKSFAFKTWRRGLSNTWSEVLRRRTRWLYGEWGSLYADHEPPALAGCDDATTRVDCLVVAALDLAREKVAFDGLGNSMSHIEPMPTLLAEAEGNTLEKAAFVAHVLRAADVDVRYAFGVRPHTRQLDAKYPSMGPINHLLLWLPAQTGLTQPIWLDPGCEHCPPGTLSDWSLGGRVFVVSYDGAAERDDQVEVRSTTASGKRAMPNRRAHRFAVQLDPDGNARVELEETYEGLRAAWFARTVRRWSAKGRQKAIESRLAQLDERARLIDGPDPICDRGAGRCTRTLRFSVPGFATVDGDDLIVPLGLLHGTSLFSQMGPKRTRDLLLYSDEAVDETMTLAMPAGFALVDGPKPFEATSDAFLTRLSMTSTPGVVEIIRHAERRRGRYAPAGHGPRRAALRKAVRTRDTRIRLRRAPATD